MGKPLANYTCYEKITRMQCLLMADDKHDTLILSVTKVIVYSANHKKGTHAY